MRQWRPLLFAVGVLLPLAACGPPDLESEGGTAAADTVAPHVAATSPVEAGAYLVQVAGCNDCHTAGWLMGGGQVPRSEWLKGWAVGHTGPWGTTYARNLRLTVQRMTEDEWVAYLGTARMQPPMPWFNLHRMSERDRRAIYRFIETLGPPGDSVPANLPPGEEPTTPYIPFTPREPGSG